MRQMRNEMSKGRMNYSSEERKSYPKAAASANIALMEREAKAGRGKGRSRKQRIAIGINKARRGK